MNKMFNNVPDAFEYFTSKGYDKKLEIKDAKFWLTEQSTSYDISEIEIEDIAYVYSTNNDKIFTVYAIKLDDDKKGVFLKILKSLNHFPSVKE